MEFEHDEARAQFRGLVDGAVACALDYRDDGSVVAMVRTFTNPPMRGNGYAGVLVEHAVDWAAAQGRTVRPACWYVEEWFARHPERAALLAR